MLKHNFDEAFDSACKAPGFAGYVRSQRLNFVVKWAVAVAFWGIVALIICCSNDGSAKLDISAAVALLLLALLLTWIYSMLFPKFGKYKKPVEAYSSLLIDVLDGCFDEEISASEVEIDRAEYEKSLPEERLVNFETAFFTAADFGINIKTSEAEINVYDIIVSETDMGFAYGGIVPGKKTNHLPGGFETMATTEMLFAVVRFPNATSSSPYNYSIKKYLDTRSEKVFVSSYDDTFYIEIDYKSFAIGAGTKKNIRRKCQKVCESVSLILEIVERV